MLVLKVLVGLHRTVPLLLFHVAGWSIGLDYHHIEWFALETNREYSEELYKKELHDQDNHDGVITNLEPDIWNVKSRGP